MECNNLVPKIRHCKDSILLLITIKHFQRVLEKDTEDEYIGIDKQGTQKKK